MNFPKDLLYTKSHEWVRMTDDTTATVGITDYAQSELGDIVFVNLPEEGDEATMGEAICDVESVKAASDIISPVTGTITEGNEELESSPESLNQDPYGAWIYKVNNITEKEEFLTAEEYEAFTKEEV